MNTKKITTILAFTIILSTLALGQTAGPNSNIEAQLINTDPVPLQSGEQGDLRFKVTNEGDAEASVEVQLIDNYPFQVKEDRQRSYDLGSLVPGQEYQISTEVVVAGDAPDGANDFRARIITGDLNRTINIPVEVQSQDIELNLANIQTQPSQLMPDTDNNQISIDIVNNGDKTAENVVLNLNTPASFEETSSLSIRKALGNINPGEMKTATFNLDINESASSGLNEFEAILEYSADDSTSEITQSNSFELNIEGKPQFRIIDSESDLRTGSTNEVRLTVENYGQETSSSTRIRVMDSSDQPFTYDSSSQYIGTLEAGQEGEAVFTIETEADADVKDYLVDFEIRGVKDTEVFVEDETASIEVQNGQEENEDGGVTLPLIGLIVVLIGTGLYFIKKRRSSPEEEETEESSEE